MGDDWLSSIKPTKRSIGNYYINDAGEIVFALYKDEDDYVHYTDINHPHETESMCQYRFYKSYKRFYEEGINIENI